MATTKDLITQLRKEYGGLITPLSDLEGVKVIPTGLVSLDAIIGGGFPVGMISEVYGPESTAKSSLCLRLVSEAQKQGLTCLYIDMELAMTAQLAQHMGVDIDKLIISRPTVGEEAFELMEDAMEKGIKLIIVDSVSSMVPGSELEADFDKESIGLQARMMSKGMRKIIGCAMRNEVAVVFVNQIRDEIQKMGFGEKTTTSGGRALRFYSALRLKMARTGWITEDTDRVGMDVQITTAKNKLHRPQLSTKVNFYFGRGFDLAEDAFNFMVARGELERVGNTYYHNGTKVGSKKDTIEYVKNIEETKQEEAPKAKKK